MDEFLALSAPEQEAILKRLTHHALCKMRSLAWRGAYIQKGGTAPGAYEPEDFALDAIEKLLSGQRSWNRERYDKIEDALLAIVDSDINHLVDSAENRKSRRLPVDSAGDEVDVPDPASTVDERRLCSDETWRDDFQKLALKELNGEPLLQSLFESIAEGITRPAEIAELYEITVEEVNNAKKRLRRKLGKLNPRYPSSRKGLK